MAHRNKSSALCCEFMPQPYLAQSFHEPASLTNAPCTLRLVYACLFCYLCAMYAV